MKYSEACAKYEVMRMRLTTRHRCHCKHCWDPPGGRYVRCDAPSGIELVQFADTGEFDVIGWPSLWTDEERVSIRRTPGNEWTFTRYDGSWHLAPSN